MFVDIDPVTFNMDPDAIARAITPRTKAILAVHQMGMPCDLARILPIARAHGIPVDRGRRLRDRLRNSIDGAWQPIGRPHGDIACFSLHPRKVITVGDGGVLTTSNAEWDQRFRLLRQHGMSVPDTVRHESDQVIFETYPVPGFNYRLTDVQAAIGLRAIEAAAEHRSTRRELAETVSPPAVQ